MKKISVIERQIMCQVTQKLDRNSHNIRTHDFVPIVAYDQRKEHHN